MTIGNILKPWAFTNNTETADATKVNVDFDVLYSSVNDLINAINTASGTKTTLDERISVSLNADGTIKGGAIPVGTYDTRTTRVVTADTVVAEGDSKLLVDTTAGDITVTLPATATAVVCPTIINTAATGYEVIIVPDVTDTVMTLDEVRLNANESIELTPSANNWWRTG